MTFQNGTVRWTGGDRGNWGDPARWENAHVPRDVQDVQILGRPAVTLTAPAAVNNLSVSGLTLNRQGYALTVKGSLNVGGAVDLSGAGALSVTGDLVGNACGLNLSGGSLACGRAYFGGDAMLFPGGNGVLNISGNGAMTVAGALNILDTDGTAVNLSGGSLTVGTVAYPDLVFRPGNPSRFHWTGGTLRIGAGPTITGPGATLGGGGELGPALSLAPGMTLVTGGVTQVRGGGTLTFAGGTLDVGSSGVAYDYDAAAASPLAALRAAVRAASNPAGASHWTAPGLTSANAAANASLAVGYAEAADVLTFASGATYASFLGQNVDRSSAVARLALAGDATLDGTVDFNDLVHLAQNYNTTISATTGSWWVNGDFTYDGVVDFNDLVKLAQNYNAALPAAPIPGAPTDFACDLAAAFAAVPEPAALGLLAPAAACALAGGGRRRRRRPRPSVGPTA